MAWPCRLSGKGPQSVRQTAAKTAGSGSIAFKRPAARLAGQRSGRKHVHARGQDASAIAGSVVLWNKMAEGNWQAPNKPHSLGLCFAGRKLVGQTGTGR